MSSRNQKGEGDLAILLAILLMAAVGMMFMFVIETSPRDLRKYHNSRVAVKCYGYDAYGRYVWWYCDGRRGV